MENISGSAYQIRPFIYTFLFLAFASNATAQNTSYYDAQWRRCKEKVATYYRKLTRQDTGVLYKVEEYDINDNIVSTGFVSDAESNNFILSRQGHFEYYNSEKKLTSEGDYIDGYADSIWKYYYQPSGHLKKKIIFHKGKMMSDQAFEDSSEALTYERWYDNGAEVAYKKYAKGTLTYEKTIQGNVYTYDANGRISTESNSEDSKTKLQHQYDENGKETITKISNVPSQIYTVIEQLPEPPFNLKDYISQNMHYPKLARKAGIQGRVLVQFIVNEDGSISDVIVVKSAHPLIDEEAKNIIASMPKWRPGKQNGKKVKVYYTQPISFKMD